VGTAPSAFPRRPGGASGPAPAPLTPSPSPDRPARTVPLPRLSLCVERKGRWRTGVPAPRRQWAEIAASNGHAWVSRGPPDRARCLWLLHVCVPPGENPRHAPGNQVEINARRPGITGARRGPAGGYRRGDPGPVPGQHASARLPGRYGRPATGSRAGNSVSIVHGRPLPCKTLRQFVTGRWGGGWS